MVLVVITEIRRYKLNILMNKIFYTILLMGISISAMAQTFKVRGVVLSDEDLPLVGATVVEKGKNNGTITDENGRYEFAVNDVNGVLIASYVGYNSEETFINAQATHHFKLYEATTLRQVTVVGSRNLNRSAADTPAPVDIIDIAEVTSKQGQLDINQLLQFAAPSFNSNRQTGSDGSDHVDPASLRGLGPDQTLVLINGKRRHQSALVNLFGTRGRGNTGTDLNAIPSAAIERIEILPDGAAAQYGSDAIAGVINIVLKSNVKELTANASGGGYLAKYRFDNQKIDGLNYNANVNYGFKVLQKGYVNLTADFNYRNHTNRANSVSDTLDLQRRQFGDPQIQNASLYFNSSFPITENIEIYSFGGINKRKGDSYAWTRFADDDRNIKSVYPNGFDPLISSVIDDRAATVGAKTSWRNWNVDISNTYGFNKFQFFVKHSLNRSLGALSQRDFENGGFQLGQNVTNLNFTRNYKTILQGLNVAFGGEYRFERYKIFAGERPSYYNYDPTLPSGSQGFPGYSPADVTNNGRSNVGAYLDLEADITKSLLVDAAVRYENYSDFGNTINGKLGARYRVNSDLAFRATLSTGFRAPSLAQKYFNSTFTNFVNGKAVDVLLANNESEVTKALGIPKLRQETSQNASIGITYAPVSNLSVTVDGYYVNVKDRVVLTGQFKNTDPKIGKLLTDLNVGQAQFFTNALSSTTTSGIDIIVAHNQPLAVGKLTTTLAANFNWMDLGDINTVPLLEGKESTYFDNRERYFVLASAPPSKINLTLDYAVNNWNVMLRLVRFGQVQLANWNDEIDTYSAKIQTDLTISYKLNKQLSLAVGGSNLLNVYPDKSNPTVTESGGSWDPVQMGSNGAFLFAKVRYNLKQR